MIHGINGHLLIPLIGLILLIISFFAKVPGRFQVRRDGVRRHPAPGRRSASSATASPAVGFVHGFWAILLFWLAYRTAKQADVVIERPHGA